MGSARDALELSRAIAGRGGYVAVIKVYMDETGTHKGSPVTAVGCYFAKSLEWGRFTRHWNVNKKPIRIFHSVDCANFAGEFKGWNKKDRDAYVAKLLPVMANAEIFGVALGVNNDAISSHAESPLTFMTSSIQATYSLCFHMAVTSVLDFAKQQGINEHIAFYHEDNDYETEALKTFSFIKRQNLYHGKLSIAFGGKDEFVPLQAADVLAYEANKHFRDIVRPKRQALDAIMKSKRVILRAITKENIGQFSQRSTTALAEVSMLGRPFSGFRR